MEPHQSNGVIRAFTLIEMMVSVTVLVLVLLMVTRMMSSATSLTTQGGKRNDADNQARLIFDRLATDFNGMTRRSDLDYIFAKQAGNDAMYFFSETARYFNQGITDAYKSSICLVGYRINSNYQLERLGQGLTWDGTFSSSSAITPGSIVFLTYPLGSSTPITGSTIAGNWASVVGPGPSYSTGSSEEYHVAGDQVYRLEVSFLQTDGTLSSSVTSYNGLQNVSAIVVALGILDNASRVIVQQNGQIPSTIGNQMIGALPDSVSGTPTLQSWKASSYLTASGVVPAAASHLRIYERAFYLNTP